MKRVTGVVQTEPDTFGSFSIMDEDGNVFGIDVEPSRRGIAYPVGSTIQATGPVMYSYSEFAIVVMRIGQIEQLND